MSKYNKRSKIIDEHKLRSNTFQTTIFLDRIAKEISAEAGCNKNNQSSAAHGYRIMAAREAKKRGCKIEINI
jgi:hypothetical protein